jgi:GNAT superfamily N-acetyltransferase
MKREALDQQMTLAIAKKTLAADFACDEACLTRDGTFLVEAREVAGRRRFPMRARSFAMTTMGSGVVIACSADRLAWARAHLSSQHRDELFSIATLASIAAFVEQDQQRLAGPDLKFLCADDTLRAVPPPDDIAIDLVSQELIGDLYAYAGFRHALGYRLDSPRPDMLATVARHHGAAVGIAGASADSDQLWQIGVDVLAGYRGRGIGKALVSQLTEAVLSEGKVPYYSTLVSNLRSSNLALGVGYWLAWTEVYALEK